MPKCGSGKSADSAPTSKGTGTDSSSDNLCSRATGASLPLGLHQEPHRQSGMQELLTFRVAFESALSGALPLLEKCDTDLASALVALRCRGRQVIHRASGVILAFAQIPSACAGLRDATADGCDLSTILGPLVLAAGWVEDLQQNAKTLVDDYVDFREYALYLAECVEVVADEVALSSVGEGPGDGRRERQAALEGALAELQRCTGLFAAPCSCLKSSYLAEGGLLAAAACARETESQLISEASFDSLLGCCDGFVNRLEQLYTLFYTGHQVDNELECEQ